MSIKEEVYHFDAPIAPSPTPTLVESKDERDLAAEKLTLRDLVLRMKDEYLAMTLPDLEEASEKMTTPKSTLVAHRQAVRDACDSAVALIDGAADLQALDLSGWAKVLAVMEQAEFPMTFGAGADPTKPTFYKEVIPDPKAEAPRP